MLEPAGTATGIRLVVDNPLIGDGLYSAPNLGVVAIAIFQVVGGGTTEIEHRDTANTIFNGLAQAPTFSTPLQVVTRNADADADLVPDSIDNCTWGANGPAEGGLNQLDGNQDGYGNACDADFNSDGVHDGGDFAPFIAAFNSFNATVDRTGDGVVDGADFGPFIALWNSLPGPSGLACAGTIPCVP